MLHIALAALAIGLFVWAGATDIRHRRIPNALAATLALAGLARILAAIAGGEPPAGAGTDLMIATLVFAVGALMFNWALLGGGDVKLLAAGALWVGAPAVPSFLVVTVLAGGVLAAYFAVRIIARRLRDGGRLRPTLPYGVAIAAGGIFATLPPL